MKLTLLILAAIIVVAVSALAFGPREAFDRSAGFSAALPDDLDAYLADAEAKIADITPGAEKEIIWVDPANPAKTPVAIVYLHGFSATKQEIRPTPDRVAAALGANLYYARFAGHGRPGDALGEISAGDWWRDMGEALAIGRRLGDRIILFGTSTGATLAAVALSDSRMSEGVAGFVGVSPNYGIHAAPVEVMTMPFGRRILPLIFGAERSWEPLNEAHGTWWTTKYPMVGLLPMGAAVAEAQNVDHAAIATPALFVFSDDDQVIDHANTREIAANWGGPHHIVNVTPGPQDSPNAHVIAGDIVSPGLTDQVTDAVQAWISAL